MKKLSLFCVAVIFLALCGSVAYSATITAPGSTAAIYSISPTSSPLGAPAFTLTVDGINFTNGMWVNFNGVQMPTTFVSSTRLTARLSDLSPAGQYPVNVGGVVVSGQAKGVTNTVTFTVTGNNPTPSITTISPASVVAGTPSFTLTVNGNNFVSGSIVNVGGSPRTTTFINAQQLTAIILATDIAAVGSKSITVVNPAPGGGTSTPAMLTITSNKGSLILKKNTINGNGTFTLTVVGQKAQPAAITTTNGLGAAAAIQYDAGTYSVTETIPAGWVLTSATCDTKAAATLNGNTLNNVVIEVGKTTTCVFTNTKNNPLPTITSVSPASFTLGNPTASVLTITGTNFMPTSTVTILSIPWLSFSPTINIASTTRITVSAPQIATLGVGSYNVMVTNPVPGGGNSNTDKKFNIINPVPSLISLTPNSTNVGSGPVVATIIGSNFIQGASAYAYAPNSTTGLQLGTAFKSATELQIQIPATSFNNPGTFNIGVVNPVGINSSNKLPFTVNAVAIQTGSIELVKATTGAAVGTFGFTATGFALNSPTMTTTASHSSTSGSASQTINNVTPGANYALSETNSGGAGWTLTSVNCINNGQAVGITNATGVTGIVVSAGRTTRCTFNNAFAAVNPPPPPPVQTGTLKIVKKTSGGDSVFSFFLGIPYAPVDIQTTSGNGASASISLPSKNFNIEEILPAGWALNAISCIYGPNNLATGFKDGNTAYNVAVNPNQVTTCTFSNTKNPEPTGRLIVTKNSTGGTGTFGFTGNTGINTMITGPQGTLNGFATRTVDLAPGIYTMTENALPGWTQTSATCDRGTPTNIQIVAGQTTNCNFNNLMQQVEPPPPTIQDNLIIKKVTPEGDALFSYTIFPTPTQLNIQTINKEGTKSARLATGTYTITETMPAGWMFASVTCDSIFTPGTNGPEGVTIGVTVSENKITTCTFTNKKIPPNTGTLKIVKKTNGPATTFDFNTNFGQNQYRLTTAGGQAEELIQGLEVKSTYSITEVVPAGWTLKSVVCDKQSTAAANGVKDIAVLANQTTTCTFTNETSQGTLRIIKNTPGSDAKFDYIASPASGAATDISITTVNGIGSKDTTLTPGIYTLTETQQTGWKFDSVSCDKGFTATQNGVNNITIASNQIITCTFKNIKPGPTITKLTPPEAQMCQEKITLAVDGTNFDTKAKVYFDSLALPTTYASPEKLTVDIASVPTVEDYYVTVVNPAPNSGTSNAVLFKVTNTTGPILTNVSPDDADEGSSNIQITLTGSNFKQNSKAYFDGEELNTTYVSATQLSAVIPSENLIQSGTYDITVSTGAPSKAVCDKNTSEPQPFTVTSSTSEGNDGGTGGDFPIEDHLPRRPE